MTRSIQAVLIIQKLNNNLPDEVNRKDDVFSDAHQNHKVNGEYNIKYFSEGEYFELIYNADNILQTEFNDPDDMGTFNYYSPVNDWANPLIYDWSTYKLYKNIKNLKRSIIYE